MYCLTLQTFLRSLWVGQDPPFIAINVQQKAGSNRNHLEQNIIRMRIAVQKNAISSLPVNAEAITPQFIPTHPYLIPRQTPT